MGCLGMPGHRSEIGVYLHMLGHAMSDFLETLDTKEGSLSDSEISVSSHWWCPAEVIIHGLGGPTRRRSTS